MSKRNRGFTLIELLVVIAIIGVLSSIVLASLSSARGKGNDAKVKAQLSSLRASAEIYYDNTGGFGPAQSGVCTAGMFADVSSGMSQYGTQANYPTGATLTCFSSATAYAVSALLPGAGGTNSWCVDSLGGSKARTTAITTTSC